MGRKETRGSVVVIEQLCRQKWRDDVAQCEESSPVKSIFTHSSDFSSNLGNDRCCPCPARLPLEFALSLMEDVFLVPGGEDAVLESALPLVLHTLYLVISAEDCLS